MAFSTKITFILSNSNDNSVTFNNVDYGFVPLGRGFLAMIENLLENFKFLNFREINEYYIDFVSEVSFEDFLKFHKEHYKHSPFDKDFHHFLSSNIQLDRYKLVHFTVYEWESGY
jgi:hypothetical protein